MSLTKVSYSMISGSPLSVLDYGAVGDGVTNDNAAVKAAVTAAVAANRPLYFPSGTYLLNAGGDINFAAAKFHIFGDGITSVLKFTGSGVGFNLNGGTNGTGVEGMIVEDLLIIGGASVTYGFYSSGVWRSYFRNIEVRECTTQAFYILHGVSNQYDCIKYSVNGFTPTTIPTRGLTIANSGAGYYTADCTFINCVMEGVPVGVYLLDGSQNIFVGGTFEGDGIGLTIVAGCNRNAFTGVWFEANTTRDIEVNGTANSFSDCYFNSVPSGPNIECVVAGGTQFIGGYLRTANLQSTSANTLFVGCGFDQNLVGTLGITGTGTYKALGLSKVDSNGLVVGQMPDVLGESGSFTATASGLTTTETGTVYYHKLGNTVTLMIPTISGTSNSTSFDLNMLPVTIRPANTQKTLMIVTNNGTSVVSYAYIQANGYIVLLPSFTSGSFTSSGTKGVLECTLTYLLN